LGVVAATVLGGLLLIGIARLLPGRPAVAVRGGSQYIGLLSTLFTVQLVWFVAQETIESLVAGVAVPSVLHLILTGAAGQLPVAMVAALALKWLAVRFEAALITLRT